MNLIQFQGEMPFSVAFRAQRLGLDCDNTAYAFPKGRLRRPNIGKYSFRLPPYDISSDIAFNVLPNIELYTSGTAWPLIFLFRNLELSSFIYKDKDLGTWCINPEKSLRFCKRCMQKQRKEYGISWWLRNLNLPMVAVCPEHRQPLFTVQRSEVIANGGVLPHEAIDISHPIDGTANKLSLKIADTVIKLCLNSSFIDPEAVKAVSQDPVNSLNGYDCHFPDLVLPDIVKEIMYPADLGNSHYPHDGLTKFQQLDHAFAKLVLYAIEEIQ